MNEVQPGSAEVSSKSKVSEELLTSLIESFSLGKESPCYSELNSDSKRTTH